MFFPRVWDASNDQGHANFYKDYLGSADGEKPGFGDNINFFFRYQYQLDVRPLFYVEFCR